MEFVLIAGPPAVGKMAVGMALASMTGFKLFHNHTSIDAVLSVFDFGTREFWKVVGAFRMSVFATAAKSQLRGLIFTFVWDFGGDGDTRFVEKVRRMFVDAGGRVSFVELAADLQERIRRADTPLRLSKKPGHNDIAAMREWMNEADKKYQLNSDGDFPYPERYLKIENNDVRAEEAATRIVEHFGFITSNVPASSPTQSAS